MKTSLFFLAFILSVTQSLCQEVSIPNTSLSLQLPNDSWAMTEQQEKDGRAAVFFKREPITDSEGRNIIPNLVIISEPVEEETNVILFSASKRALIPFSVEKVFTHEDESPILTYENAIGYEGTYTDKLSLKHSVYVIHLLDGTTGVQIIMDMTSSLIEEYGKEFIRAISSIQTE